MYTQTKALKEGKSVEKPIYNHVTGVFDPAEKIESPKILVRSPHAAAALCMNTREAGPRRLQRHSAAAALQGRRVRRASGLPGAGPSSSQARAST
jgi:hypothetical protein